MLRLSLLLERLWRLLGVGGSSARAGCDRLPTEPRAPTTAWHAAEPAPGRRKKVTEQPGAAATRPRGLA